MNNNIKSERFSLGVFALSNRFLILGFLAIVGVAGIASMFRLKVEAYPDIGDTEVMVITEYPGRAAAEVEQLVTLPLERALNNIPGLINRRSTTIFGLSQLRLTFEDGVDDYFARSRVQERLTSVDLPEGANPPQLGPLAGPTGEIYRYVIEAVPGVTQMDVREAQDWVIIPNLLRTEGVADVNTVGGDLKQYQVELRPEQLNRFDIDLDDVQNAIEKNNANTGGNILRRGSQDIPVRAVGAVRDEKDLLSVVLGEKNNVPIFLRDVADVKIGARPYRGIFGYSFAGQADHDQAVEGIVVMLRHENPSEVVERLQSRLQFINQKLKELGMRMKTVINRTELVSATLHTVAHTLVLGMVLVVAVIMFFLRSWRAAVVTAAVIPLSLLFAFILMDLAGIPANLLSLGAVDFGIVVDASIVIMESIIRRFSHPVESEKNKGKLHIIGGAVGGIEKPILISVSIIICAYIPIFLFQRIEGKLFRPMAYTIAFAMIGSLILSVLAVPVLSSWMLPDNFEEKHNPVILKIEKLNEKLLQFFLNNANRTLLAIAGIVIFLLSLSWFLGMEFLPQLDEGGINLRCILPSGSSLSETKRVADDLRKTIISFPEVAAVVSAAGRNDDGTDPYNPNRLEITVPLKPYDTWTTGRTKDILVDEMASRLRAQVPGARFSFSQPILDNVSEAVTGSVADLAIILRGQDLTELRAYADQVLGVIKTIRGSTANGIEQDGPSTQLTITMDRLSAARFGVNFSDIQDLVEMAIGGKAVSSLYQGERKFEISVRYPFSRRATPLDIGALLVKNSAGSMVPLSAVATIEFVNGQSVISRKNGERVVSVWTEISGRDQGSFVHEAQTKVESLVHLPSHIQVDWGGQYENLTRAGRRLLYVVPLTVLIIFAILFLLFREMRDCLLVMANVPFAITGGITALLIRGMNLNISAGVGFISLFGVAVMDGVIFIYNFREKEKNNPGVPLAPLVLEGAKERFRPVMMVMTVAILGLIPAATATGIGSDVQRPMATVIVGGLISAFFLSIVGLPLIFLKSRQKGILQEEYRVEEERNRQDNPE